VKLVVYIPALNEAATIARVLDSIPVTIAGLSEIVKIVIDDGSTDATAAIARHHGALVISHARNRGTGRTFVAGVAAALRARADVIVSMDGDGQFDGGRLPALLAPILARDADVVLCTRFGSHALMGTMPSLKRAGNWLLARAVTAITGQRFSDVSCGFRAFTREAAMRVDIHSDFEYIHESLMHWSRVGLRIMEVSLPVLAERPVGNSRMLASVHRYAMRSAPVLLRAIRDCSPMKFFGFLALVTFVCAFLLGLGVFGHWLRTGQTIPYTGLIPVSVGGVVLGFVLGVLALMADLIARLRLEVEELLYESRKSRLVAKKDTDLAA
jgi:glycosyltransferase involved in cell wall biosynthesis